MTSQHEVTLRDGSALLVNDYFPTIQGEGPDAGIPAIFLRLAKCNLRCFFCDTEFDQGSLFTVERLAETLDHDFRGGKARLLVITGGEPFVQNFLPLLRVANEIGYDVSIETAGTLWLVGGQHTFVPWYSVKFPPENRIVCSPKTPKLHPEIIPFIYALKYIIREGEVGDDGLPIFSTQMNGEPSQIFRDVWRVKDRVFLQPMDEGDPILNAANAKAAAESCMRHGYRLSVQLHKIVGLP